MFVVVVISRRQRVDVAADAVVEDRKAKHKPWTNRHVKLFEGHTNFDDELLSDQ